jgi:hypothetical protein
MEVSLKFKVGDKFTLPDNEYFPGIYKITRIERGYDEPRYWAKMDNTELYSTDDKMRRVTKLDLALK